MALFPRMRSRKSKKLKPVVLDEEKLAEKVALQARELQEKEMREKRQQQHLAIYSHLSPRQKRRLKVIAERKGVKNEQE